MCLVFAFVHKTALLASLDALVTEEADDPASLSHTERQKREAEAMGELHWCDAASARDCLSNTAAAVHRKPCCKSRRLSRRARTCKRIIARTRYRRCLSQRATAAMKDRRGGGI